MSEKQRQQVSALVDGELPRSRASGLLRSVEHDPELSALWERYHLIGNALRGDAIHVDSRRIAEHVYRELQQEPTVLAPRASRRHRVSQFAPFAGAALAAGIAFLAVFAVPSLFGPTSEAPLSRRPMVLAEVTPPPIPFRLEAEARRWPGHDPVVGRKLDRFLVTHQEESPTSSIKGILPYATLVSYEPGR